MNIKKNNKYVEIINDKYIYLIINNDSDQLIVQNMIQIKQIDIKQIHTI